MMAHSQRGPAASHDASEIPVEIEIYVNPDGSVTFADLEEQAIEIARALDPDCELACDLTPPLPVVSADDD